jgi:hypothetical protein
LSYCKEDEKKVMAKILLKRFVTKCVKQESIGFSMDEFIEKIGKKFAID